MLRLCFAAWLLICSAVHAQSPAATTPTPTLPRSTGGGGGADAAHVYIITFGPGAEVWEKFGHNMLLIHDPQGRIVDSQGAAGITDAAYNWGMFDFDSYYPFRFIAGKLRYWMDAYPSDVDDYIHADLPAFPQELSPAQPHTRDGAGGGGQAGHLG